MWGCDSGGVSGGFMGDMWWRRGKLESGVGFR